MKYTIDRVEEGMALCEGPEREMKSIPVADLPFPAKEGTSFEEVDGVYRLLPVDKQRWERLRRLMDSLFESK